MVSRYGRGEPPWAHDYPRAERNFARILQEITLIKPHLDGSNIFTLDDPELLRLPDCLHVRAGLLADE